MFSGFELTTIKNWALVGKEILGDHLNSKIFTPAEKEDKRREYAALVEIIEKTRTLQVEYVQMDADHLIHVLEVCTKYGEHIWKQFHGAEMSPTDYMSEMYQIGYIQGRAEIGLLTVADMNVINEWEDSLG